MILHIIELAIMISQIVIVASCSEIKILLIKFDISNFTISAFIRSLFIFDEVGSSIKDNPPNKRSTRVSLHGMLKILHATSLSYLFFNFQNSNGSIFTFDDDDKWSIKHWCISSVTKIFELSQYLEMPSQPLDK